MNLQKYNLQIVDYDTNMRILFTLNGNQCYRTLRVREKLEEDEILSSLCDYLSTGKCSLKPIPAGFVSLRHQIMEAENIASIDNTYEEVLSEYESDIKLLQEKLNDALDTINKLNSNLQHLKFKTSGSEFESQDELECIMEVLSDYYKSSYQNFPYASERKEIIKNFLSRNSYESNKKEVTEHIKKTLYSSFSTTNGFDIVKLKRGLNKVGLDVSTQGDGHNKIFVVGYEQCSMAISKTPSDSRGLENCVREILTLLYR